MELSTPRAASHPATGPWWPSPWGPDDQRGAMNRVTAMTVMRAAGWIKRGEVLDLGFPFRSKYPDFHHRDYVLATAGGPSGGPMGASNIVYNDDVISGQFTGMSTHFNALVHCGQQLGEHGDARTIHYYNGYSHAEIAGPWGFKKLGMENVPPVFITATVVDLAAYRGAPLEPGEIYGIEDIRGALGKQGLSEGDIGAGEALFCRVGNDHLYFSDPERYVAGAPGMTPETAEWLASLEVAVVGADAIALEPVPPVSDRLGEVHATFLCRNGIHCLININLEPLTQRGIWQAAFGCGPVAFTGAQGSPARPFAIV